MEPHPPDYDPATTLGEIRGILTLRDDGKAPCGHVLDLLRWRADEVGETIRHLRGLKVDLDGLVERAVTLDPPTAIPNASATSLVGRSRGRALSVRR